MKGNEDLCAEFRRAVDLDHTIVLSLNCSIRYSGRAESFLPHGDRLLIIKGDKTLLVHQPNGSVAVNYMKEGSRHTLSLEGKELVLSSRNLAEKEYLDVVIKEVYFMNSRFLKDGHKLQIVGSERDMSDMIYANPLLIEKGFRPISQEERTKYGFIDVFGHDKDNILVIIECKRYAGDFKAVSQLRRYVEKMQSLKALKKVRGILACPKISPNARKMLTDFGFEYRELCPPKYLERHDKLQKRLGEY